MSDNREDRKDERNDFVEVTDAVGRPLGWTHATATVHPAGPPVGLARERWRLAAACRGLPTALFFSDDTADEAEAIATCATCRVADACLSYAIEHAEFGIWGGRTPEERKRLRRRIRRNRTA